MDKDPVFQKTEQITLIKKVYSRGFPVSQRFVQSSPLKAKFRDSFVALMATTFFCLFGVGIFVSLAASFFNGELFTDFDQHIYASSDLSKYIDQTKEYIMVFLLLLLGIVAICTGHTMSMGVKDAIIFDKEKDCFYVQRKQTGGVFRRTKKFPEHMGFISNIYALQILKGSVKQMPLRIKRFKPSHVIYIHYELNLVLKDGSRVNITDNSDYSGIQITATQVAKFLNVPVWDQTSGAQILPLFG